MNVIACGRRSGAEVVSWPRNLPLFPLFVIGGGGRTRDCEGCEDCSDSVSVWSERVPPLPPPLPVRLLLPRLF